MMQDVSGAQVSAYLRALRTIIEDAERERRQYSYGAPEWMPLYLRSIAAQGIGYGVETARAWPELLAQLVQLGAERTVELVLASAPDTIGAAWDVAKRLEQVPA